ncbi:universal stress protein [Corynebacterium yudongzhengii]|uniref:Universal stress protein n=1 Tax=Corynebacterium yudongzhengii TaxID=2080740 RepID=A0A2U1T604_9CORY|nr:universal stress protein [Corynebacterium yudongzhengii]AWB81988.1 universal stress protein [Corynebacterium yudongzhengii]PWC01450.1 universal stress protein [Corynebacterium yudongzhengii]
MYSYKTLVVGTDGSDTSLVAVRHAAAMARAFDATLVIVCAFYSNSGSLLNSPNRNVSTLPVVSDNRADEYLREAEAIAREEEVTDIKLERRSGTPVNALLAAVEDTSADAIVIGNKGMSSLTGRVFGNIPTEIARRSTCDVVLVQTEDK